MRVELPGFGEVMRAESMKITPNAIISRNLAAVVDDSLVIALPGKPSGAGECLGFVAGAIPHGVAVSQRQPSSCLGAAGFFVLSPPPPPPGFPSSFARAPPPPAP